MAYPSFKSVIWRLVTLDVDDKVKAWCNIKNNNKCTNPLSRGGKDPRNYATIKSQLTRIFEIAAYSAFSLLSDNLI